MTENNPGLTIVSEDDAVDVHDLRTPAEMQAESATPPEPEEVEGAEGEEQERDEQGKFKPKRSAQARIDEITAARRQAERDLATERAINATLMAQMEQAQKVPQPRQAEHEPKLEDYNYDAVLHAQAVGAYQVRKQMADEKAAETQRAAVAAQVRRDAEWDVRTKEFATQYPDFDAKVKRDDLAISPTMGVVIKASPKGPEMAYYLADHPEEASQIAALPTELQPYRLGLIESKLATIKPRTPAAPPPVAPVAGSGERPSVDPDTDMRLSPEAWAAKRNARLREERYGKKG